jgi:SNF2 family DNA or RNA helicase
MTPTSRNAATAMRATLYPHQAEAVAWLLGHPRALLAHATGLGKTVEGIAYIAALSQHGELPLLRSSKQASQCRALWVTDATLLEQTRRSIARFLPGFTVEVGGPSGQRGHKRWRATYGDFGPDILLMNYELVNSRKHWLDTFTPALVVMDEIGKIRNGGAQWKAVRTVSRRAPRSVGMTASWLQNSPADLHRILDAIGTPELWPYKTFEERFCTMRYTHTDAWGRDHYTPDDWTDDPRQLGEMRTYLDGCMHQLDIGAVGLALPERVGSTQRWVQLSHAEQRAYDTAAKWRGLHGHQRREKAPKTAGADSALIAALMEELSAREPGQAIVYCESLDMLALAGERFSTSGVTHVVIEGKVSQEDRTKAVDAFRAGEVRVLLGSRVLEHGLDLQHCRVLISVDSSWNPERERQREGRIRRIGSPHATCEHLTLLPDTPHTRNKLATVEKKSRLADAIFLNSA